MVTVKSYFNKKEGADPKVLNLKKSLYDNSQTQWFIDI